MRLFATEFFQLVRIDTHTLGTPEETGFDAFMTGAVSRYNLIFQVTKPSYSKEGLLENSYVTFRFQSVEFPELSTDTSSNLNTY